MPPEVWQLAILLGATDIGARMRQMELSPPRSVPEDPTTWPQLLGATAASDGGLGVDSGGSSGPPRFDPLGSAVVASEKRRALFHPRRGWWRRFERAGSRFLDRHVFPRIPQLHRPYDAQLRRSLTLSVGSIEIRGLPRNWSGLRILLITDIHAGPFVSSGQLRESFERLLHVRPDVVLLGGDLVTSRLVEWDERAAAFASLRAPLGVWAVPGNHDHYTGELPDLIRRVESAGIGVLRNRSTVLHHAGAAIHLAGIDDALVGEPDLEAALAGARSPVVLLSHNPDVAFEAARRGVDLVLSGHTHAGQVRIPGLPVLVRQSRFRLDEGRYRIGETELVVSRGLGASGVPWRYACPPEAVLIRLLSVPSSA